MGTNQGDGDTKMNQLIQDAIRTKNMIEFDYGGHHRITEPHVHGVHDGVEQLLAYQVEGGSSSGGLPEWRRVDVPRMSNLRKMDRTFAGPRPNPSGRHSPWDTTYPVVK